jgi:hypothetical protein
VPLFDGRLAVKLAERFPPLVENFWEGSETCIPVADLRDWPETPSNTVSPLAHTTEFRERATLFREHEEASVAIAYEKCAETIEKWWEVFQHEPLTLAQAVAESGYTRGHLKRLLSSGTITNSGSEGEPSILRCDLPKKPGHGVAPVQSVIPISRTQVARAIAAGEE